jgi:hypothetical protein
VTPGGAPGTARRFLPDALAAAALGAAVWAVYGRVRSLWWTFDDLFLLHVLQGRSAIDFFFSPGLWRGLPFRMFLPVLLASYDLDFVIAGAQPRAFYVHELLACTAAAVALFAVFRRWFGTTLSGVGALLFVLGAPFVTWAQQIMHRHYVEGFVFAAVSVWLFVGALRRGRKSAALFSALFYLLATLAKEVYIPLPGILALLPEGSWRERLHRLVPHAAAAVLYFAWRVAMIGTMLGGYGWALRPGDLPAAARALPGHVAASLLPGSRTWNLVLFAVLAAGAIVYFRRAPRALAPILGAAILTILPAVPVSKAAGVRFAAMPWALAVAVFVSGCALLLEGSARARAAAALLLGLAAVSGFAANRARWNLQWLEVERMSAEGRFLVSMAPGDLLRSPSLPPAAREETRWFREEYLHRPAGGAWFEDDFSLCGGPRAGRIWEYDVREDRVRDVTARARSRAAARCDSWKRNAPLRASLSFSGNALFWDFGPYVTGSYAILRNRGADATPVDRVGGYRLSTPAISLMVRYVSAAGWVTYSPELTLDSRTAANLSWERRLASR